MIKLTFGQRIFVWAKLSRKRDYVNRTRTWAANPLPLTTAIFLGYRTVYEGKIVGGDEEPYLRITKSERVALVCTSPLSNPFYAPLEAIDIV